MSKCAPLAGKAKGAVLWELEQFDINRLRGELPEVVGDWNWSQGNFGHSLPLTTTRLSPFGASHQNNLVKGADGSVQGAADRLRDNLYFREVFDSFECP